MNEAMGRYGGKLIAESKNFEIIHAHDWLVADAAIALKHIFKLPLIATNSQILTVLTIFNILIFIKRYNSILLLCKE